MIDKIKNIAIWVSVTTYQLIIKGFMIASFWDWFIVDAFNLPEISIIQANGISLLLTVATANSNLKARKYKDFMDRMFYVSAYYTAMFLIYWTIGFVLHSLM